MMKPEEIKNFKATPTVSELIIKIDRLRNDIVHLSDTAIALWDVVEEVKKYKQEVDKLLILDEAHIRPSWDNDCWTKIGRDHEYIKSLTALKEYFHNLEGK